MSQRMTLKKESQTSDVRLTRSLDEEAGCNVAIAIGDESHK